MRPIARGRPLGVVIPCERLPRVLAAIAFSALTGINRRDISRQQDHRGAEIVFGFSAPPISATRTRSTARVSRNVAVARTTRV